MKGVSSVIAIILILMIVIALAALAYTWFSGIFASLTGTASVAVSQTTGAMGTQFRIEAAKYTGSNLWNVNVTVRNIGTQNFNPNKTAIYIGGSPANYAGICVIGTGCSATTMTNLPSQATAIFYNVTNATGVLACTASGGAIVGITIETGLQDSRTISC